MQTHLLRRSLRRLWAFVPSVLLQTCKNWQWLGYYPVLYPSDDLLQRWNASHWEEYQNWLQKHTLQHLAQWQELHQQHRQWRNPPKISIVTPVFNTEPAILYECILSVRMQTYPYWQWILVDDGSARQDTKALLASGVLGDPRIQVIFAQQSQGISAATNKAIAQATGDFVVFLDHDDRLSLEALGSIAETVHACPDVDIVYSDRDMLSEQNERYLHLFKPDWSPETLLSGNYVFHLMCYRRTLLRQLNGLRSDYDGSQDYDLILRAAEYQPNVRHIAKILYHWRQHPSSVALHAGAKDYAFAAGLKALNAALTRRGIAGTAREIPQFWRGTYEVLLTPTDSTQVQLVHLDTHAVDTDYAQQVQQALQTGEQPYIVILADTIRPDTQDTLTRLVAWLQHVDGVALASPKVVNADDTIDYIGMAYTQDASLMYPYRGFPVTEPGYMGVTQIVRNISAPHPFCVAFKRTTWQQLQGFTAELKGPQALLDFALRAQQGGARCVVVPQCQFVQQGEAFVVQEGQDKHFFSQCWQAYLSAGDPYYNPNLADHSPDMGLDI